MDKPWLTELFNEIKTGNLGPLDTNKASPPNIGPTQANIGPT